MLVWSRWTSMQGEKKKKNRGQQSSSTKDDLNPLCYKDSSGARSYRNFPWVLKSKAVVLFFMKCADFCNVNLVRSMLLLCALFFSKAVCGNLSITVRYMWALYLVWISKYFLLLSLTIRFISHTESVEQKSPIPNATESSHVKEKSKKKKTSEENPSSKKPRVQSTISSLFQKAAEKKVKL